MKPHWERQLLVSAGEGVFWQVLPFWIAASGVLLVLVSLFAPAGGSCTDLLAAVSPVAIPIVARTHLSSFHSGRQHSAVVTRLNGDVSEDSTPVSDDSVSPDRSQRENTLEVDRFLDRTPIGTRSAGNATPGRAVRAGITPASSPPVLRI